jgi:spore coat polysaccharide biosynthesis predicted glycosyltransferase SpsG
MSYRPRVAIVAEVGHRVGCGHVSRCVILQRILARECCVTLKVVNREPWDDSSLASEFALRESVDADIVFADGLELREELTEKVHADLVVSLSYMSDINETADLVVAPALNGTEVPGHFLTDLDALLCNRPKTMAAPVYRAGHPPTIGICMGGADVEGLGPKLEVALNELGYRARIRANDASRRRTLSLFLEDKLRERQEDPFPYYALSGCDVVVCQGGLSAIELALLGIPAVLRTRSDFTAAYGFLESLGCSLRLSGDGIVELLGAVSMLCEDTDRRSAMVRSCSALGAQIRESFWIMLVDKLVKKGARHEAMPVLWR